MSGGLDSTYCAHLLRQKGHTVEGALLVFHSLTDTSAAERSCKELDIPLHIIDCSKDFEKYVISDFVNCYKNGKTPNPCTVCNRFVKMEYLYRACKQLGFDRYATGHYARVHRDPESGRYYVSRAKDPKKDQSYMLWAMTGQQLALLETPLADITKEQARKECESLGLSVSLAKESQDICFIEKGRAYTDFLEERLGKPSPGAYLDKDGNKIGTHQGVTNYTVGQRKGLGQSFGRHMFITKIDAPSNSITLCDTEDTYAKGVLIDSINAQRLCYEKGVFKLSVKIRYAAQPVPCTLKFEGKTGEIIFDTPIRTPAPGQSAVLYDGDDLMLGGIISDVIY